MTFASGAFGQLSYIQEATKGVTPVAGNGANLRTTSPGMKATTSTVKSKEISATRMVSSTTNSDLNVDGSFDFELSGKEFDPFIQGSLYGTYAHYGTNGLGTTFSASTTSSTITAAVAPTTTSAFTNITVGSWIKLVPPAGATQAVKDYFADAWFKVHTTTAPTSTVITLDPSTPIVAPGIVTAVAGYAITQSLVQNGNTVRSFTFEWNQADIGQILAFRGMQSNSMSLKLEVGSIVTGQFGFTGMAHTINAATTLPGATAASQSLDVMNAVTDVGLVMENGANLLGVNNFIQSVQLDVTNNLRTQKAIGVYGNSDIGVGELAVSGQLQVYFESATYYKKWLQGTNTSLVFGMADPLGNGYLVELDKVRFVNGGLSAPTKDSDVILSLPFEAYFNAATNRGIRITRAISA